jgi:hypothetical protein
MKKRKTKRASCICPSETPSFSIISRIGSKQFLKLAVSIFLLARLCFLRFLERAPEI